MALHDTAKRRRTWAKQWDRAGLTAHAEAVARGDCYDPHSPELIPPPAD